MSNAIPPHQRSESEVFFDEMREWIAKDRVRGDESSAAMFEQILETLKHMHTSDSDLSPLRGRVQLESEKMKKHQTSKEPHDDDVPSSFRFLGKPPSERDRIFTLTPKQPMKLPPKPSSKPLTNCFSWPEPNRARNLQKRIQELIQQTEKTDPRTQYFKLRNLLRLLEEVNSNLSPTLFEEEDPALPPSLPKPPLESEQQ